MSETKKLQNLTPNELLKLLPKELRYELEENNQRKDYSFMETAEIQEKLHQILQEKFPRGRKSNESELNDENCKRIGTLRSFGVIRIDDLIGGYFNESAETVRRRREIYNTIEMKPKKYEKIVKRVDKGKTSFTRLYHTVRRKEKPNTPPLPVGMFDVLDADPPWPYEFGLSGAAENHYNTMSIEEICELGKKLPVADNAILFLWSTIPKLNDALQVMAAWGFSYRTAIIWVKKMEGKIQVGTGYYVRNASEILLIGIKGNPGVPLEEDRPINVVEATRTRHSEKPEIFYDIIEKMYPNRKYLELFSRAKKKRTNWTYWGLEANSN